MLILHLMVGLEPNILIQLNPLPLMHFKLCAEGEVWQQAEGID